MAVLCLGRITRDTGGQTYFNEILGPLSTEPDIEVDVHYADPDFVVPPTCRGVRYPLPASLRSIGRVVAEALVAAWLRRGGYDVLLAPINFLPPTWRGPCVTVQHNALAGKGADARRDGAWRALYRRLASASTVDRSTALIAVSEHLRSLLLSWYPDLDPARVHVVPLAPSGRLERTADSLGTIPRERLVLVVGALWSHKRVGDALAAFGAIADELSDYRLEIIGPGAPEARRSLMDLARDIGVVDRVTFRGHLSPEELAASFRRARLLLFTSRVESFGLPVLEAMACGVPVVARRIAALDELVAPAPAWVDVDAQPAQIGRCALAVLKDEQLWTHHAEAGKKVAARYSWERTAALTANVLRGVVEHGRVEAFVVATESQ
ncbi:hypothetical protein AYO48_03355 [Gaiella sp. SCGC AG-212-M14]|nr:hypothetical protein AYO48_03355 [Gaiella sp. SCGC AG-212-M14]